VPFDSDSFWKGGSESKVLRCKRSPARNQL